MWKVNEERALAAFGKADTGEDVHLLTLHSGPLSCRIITYGAALQALSVPNRDGQPVDIVLGYDSLEEYLRQDGYLGAVVGRYANRIAGSQFVLNGKSYSLAANEGRNHLHGGRRGFSHRVWQIEALSKQQAVLSLTSEDGEEGYPSRLQVRVIYLLAGNTLSIRYLASAQQDTVCSLTNHTYFNLSGHGSGTVYDQSISVSAEAYTPCGRDGIPDGTIVSVAGTLLDLRSPAAFGPRLSQLEGGFDHNFILCGSPGALRHAAQTFSPASGIVMGVDTTMPAMQLYTAGSLGRRRGKGGRPYGPCHGFCLETQHFPDAPNQSLFPSAILRAGEIYDHSTRFYFSTRD